MKTYMRQKKTHESGFTHDKAETLTKIQPPHAGEEMLIPLPPVQWRGDSPKTARVERDPEPGKGWFAQIRRVSSPV